MMTEDSKATLCSSLFTSLFNCQYCCCYRLAPGTACTSVHYTKINLHMSFPQRTPIVTCTYRAITFYQRFGSAQKKHIITCFPGLEKQVWHRTIIIFSHWNNVAATAMLMFLKHWNILIPFKLYLMCYLSVTKNWKKHKSQRSPVIIWQIICF